MDAGHSIYVHAMKYLFRLLCLCLPLLTSCDMGDDEQEWALPVGSALPHFIVTTDDGRTITEEDFIGRTGIIVFFNTTCSDCRRELPLLQQAYNDSLSAGSDALFLCIAREETAPVIREYWEREGLTLPFSPQSDRRVYNLFANLGIPRIFVTATDGRVRQSLTDWPR